MSDWASKPGSAGTAVAFAEEPPARRPAVNVVNGAPQTSTRAYGRRRDPVSAILGLDGEDRFYWFYVGLAVAAALHAAVLLIALVVGLMHEIRALMKEDRLAIEDHFSAVYDVDLAPKPKVAIPPPKPIEAPPEPAPAPAPIKAAPKPKDDPYDQPPPAPALASKVLVKNDDPNEKLDFTKDGFTTNDHGTATYGQQSAQGKGDKPVVAPNANINGVPGGTGTGTAPVQAPPPGPDRSAPPGLVGGTAWSCPFPPEADADQIDQAVATIVVQVRADGSPLSVTVTGDPGHGFGRAARICALGKRFSPALDRNGNPVSGTTPPIRVRFNR